MDSEHRKQSGRSTRSLAFVNFKSFSTVGNTVYTPYKSTLYKRRLNIRAGFQRPGQMTPIENKTPYKSTLSRVCSREILTFFKEISVQISIY